MGVKQRPPFWGLFQNRNARNRRYSCSCTLLFLDRNKNRQNCLAGVVCRFCILSVQMVDIKPLCRVGSTSIAFSCLFTRVSIVFSLFQGVRLTVTVNDEVLFNETLSGKLTERINDFIEDKCQSV